MTTRSTTYAVAMRDLTCRKPETNDHLRIDLRIDLCHSRIFLRADADHRAPLRHPRLGSSHRKRTTGRPPTTATLTPASMLSAN